MFAQVVVHGSTRSCTGVTSVQGPVFVCADWEHARLYRCDTFPKYLSMYAPTACLPICALSVAAPACGRVVSVCSWNSRAWSPASTDACAPFAPTRRDAGHQTYCLPRLSRAANLAYMGAREAVQMSHLSKVCADCMPVDL